MLSRPYPSVPAQRERSPGSLARDVTQPSGYGPFLRLDITPVYSNPYIGLGMTMTPLS